MNKKIVLPFSILFGAGMIAFILSAQKSPPEQKEQTVQSTYVTVAPLEFGPMNLIIESYGIARPLNETQMVAEISGPITYISPLFNRGQQIKRGDILAKIDARDYQARLIEAEANLAAAKAALELEKALGKVAEDEWDNIKNRKPTALSLRKPQLAQEIARVKGAEAALTRAQNDLARTEIRAPYDALIEDRSVSIGSYVNQGVHLGRLLSTEKAEIRLPVPAHDIPFLDNRGIGAQVTLTSTQALDQTWQATIVREEGVIDDNSRMNYLIAELNDPYGKSETPSHSPLRFGTYVTAQIEGLQLAKAAKVPSHLVRNGALATVSEENTLAMQSVEVFRQQGSEVIITSGGQSGQQYVTSALRFTVEGMPLSFDSEELNPDVEPTIAADKLEQSEPSSGDES